ncbi:MAG TPA: UDP-N-acetylmuramoyl-L-alanine--D-glutamate ligase, partial [Candidatus Saccharimonadia bacterium]|nr:UDP-N-acetylmuramoyl-L-alanine--D-glutamate ligase [Candidatus Saccharimonadia bacterium]
GRPNLPRCDIAPPTAESLSRYHVVIKSPGISPYKSPVPEALEAGVRFVSGTALWFAERGSARTIAVTGTKGKSTTVALIAHLLRAAGRRVALCGNIGIPLLELLDPPAEPDWWVIELSSFQTRDMEAVPEVAVVLNLFPEHLDWHAGHDNYARDKLAILGDAGLRPRLSILGPDVEPSLHAAATHDGDVGGASAPTEVVVGAEAPPVVRFGMPSGFHPTEEGIARGGTLLVPWRDLPLPGRHNALNVCAALTVLDSIGVDVATVLPALATFEALPHRLQPLGVRDGLEYVNDSIATTPHATLAALAFFAQRKVTVLVGGYDRGVPWAVFRTGMEAAPVHAVIAMGQNGARIAAALGGLSNPRVLRAETLDEAMPLAREITPAGGVVLLSPGAPSFGEFRDYVERGQRFAQLAGFDPDAIASIGGLGIA